MKSVQREEAKPLPHHSHRRAIAFTIITGLSTAIAVIWALSDTGEIDNHWGHLALIFFTWLVAIMTAMILSRTKE